jgi:radical SAM protein with 4Fe4S-binding SPASM domain
MHLPELCYGTLGVDSVADSWCRHPMLQSLRSELPDKLEGICASCLMRKQCLGSCVANNYHQSGRLTEAFWFCQQAAAKDLFPISRIS